MLLFLLNRFQLECSDPNVVEVDITVSGGVTSNLKQRELFQGFDRVPLKLVEGVLYMYMHNVSTMYWTVCIVD